MAVSIEEVKAGLEVEGARASGSTCERQPPTPQTADHQYMEGFNDELEAFKERVRGRAKLRIEKAVKEYEEEERQKRLGPGGLDPVEVYESLPEVGSPTLAGRRQVGPSRVPGVQALTTVHLLPQKLQKCFDVKDVQMLQETISKMDPTVSNRAPGTPASRTERPGKQWAPTPPAHWRRTQPGYHATCTNLLSTHCVSGIQ